MMAMRAMRVMVCLAVEWVRGLPTIWQAPRGPGAGAPEEVSLPMPSL
jgi:hypothetical protein